MIRFTNSRSGTHNMLYVTTDYGDLHYRNKKKVHHTETVHDNNHEIVNIDYDKNGKILGVEIIC